MKALIIHLSDLHAREGSESQCRDLGYKIGNATKSLASDTAVVVLAFTGDIAFSGKATEYNAAIVLIETVRQIVGVGMYVCMCPGNHDLDFIANESVRRMVIKELLSDGTMPLDDSAESALVKPQTNFFECAHLLSAWIPEDKSRLVWTRSIPCEGQTISICSINTACASEKEETKGNIIFPLNALKRLDSSTDELTIFLFHHPLGWMSDGTANPARNQIERIADVILTGHEHEPGSYVKIKGHDRNEYIEGGTLGSHGNADPPMFNTLVIDTNVGKQLVSQWRMCDGIFQKSTDDNIIFFNKNARRLHGTFILNEKWRSWLNEPGAGYCHPKKHQIQFDDIFICPDFEVEQGNDEPEIIHGNDIIDTCLKERKVIILGPEFSGRSSVAKTLFSGLCKLRKVPIYVNTANLKAFKEERFHGLIDQIIPMQYQGVSGEHFRQLPNSDKVVLLDNWERTGHLVLDDKNAWLQAFGRQADTIVLFAANEVHYENVVVHKHTNSELLKYTKITIQDCGFLLRRQIIRKWFTLGGVATADEPSIDRAVEVAFGYINSAISSGLTKAYAPMILLMLQVLELKRPLTTASSSFIHLYDSLIKDGLSRIVNQKVDPDKKSAVCERLAWHMFNKNTSNVTKEEFSKIIRELVVFSGSSISEHATLQELQNGKLLLETDDWICFRYGYCYYYFVALHLSHHIDEENVQKAISNISQELYNEHKANILLYLTYHNRDKRILNTVLLVAKGLFSGYSKVEIDTFGTVLCSGFDRMNFIMPSDDVEVNQERSLAIKDKIQREMQRMEPSEKSERTSGRVSICERRHKGTNCDEKSVQVTISGTDSNETQIIQSLNAAHKTIQILGQLMRNLPGTMSMIQKAQITDECYSLGMRMLSSIKDLFLLCRDDIIRYIIQEDIFECKSRAKDDADARERALRIFCMIPQSIAFNVIKQVSDSVGTSDYGAVYDEIINKNPNNRAYELIDVSVRLDHGGSFPKDLILQRASTYKATEFSLHILKRMVFHRLIMHKVNRDVKNEVCSKLGIKANHAKILAPKK